MSISRFHDSDYDGVVLKIPLWFIEMNNLQLDFENFKVALQSANKSMYYPDHVSNLYELDNYTEKKEIINKYKQAEALKKEKDIQYRKDLVEGNVYELIWESETCAGMYDYINFNDEHVDFWDIATPKKGNITKKGYDQLYEKFKLILDGGYNSLLRFSERNGLGKLTNNLVECGELNYKNNIINFKFYGTSYFNIGISFEVLKIKEYILNKNKALVYKTFTIGQDDKGYFYCPNYSINHKKYLTGFERSGFHLIKK